MTRTRQSAWLTIIATAILLLATILPIFKVEALSTTSLLLSDPRTSATGVTYTFTSSGFTTGTSIQCIDLFLNDAADGTGSAVGTTTSFTLDSSTVITAGSWTENTAVNGRVRITSAGETPSASGNIVFGGIVNGATEGTTYFGLFRTYSNAGCSTVVDQATVAYVFNNGELVQLSVDPTLTFTAAGVTGPATVNGVSVTADSTGTGIDFLNDVTSVANGVSAHDLQVSTNAPNGYTVYIRHTGQLNNGSNNIANWTGTNGTPTTIAGTGTELWAYTTEDSNLAGGTANRFTNGGAKWAGFSTTNAPVVDNTGATSGTETTRVGQQVGIATTTPAGTYQTTIIYTAASYY